MARAESHENKTKALAWRERREGIMRDAMIGILASPHPRPDPRALACRVKEYAEALMRESDLDPVPWERS